jgi:hypothetical protein
LRNPKKGKPDGLVTTEFPKEGYGSKRAVLPMMMIKMICVHCSYNKDILWGGGNILEIARLIQE